MPIVRKYERRRKGRKEGKIRRMGKIGSRERKKEEGRENSKTDEVVHK